MKTLSFTKHGWCRCKERGGYKFRQDVRDRFNLTRVMTKRQHRLLGFRNSKFLEKKHQPLVYWCSETTDAIEGFVTVATAAGHYLLLTYYQKKLLSN
jgi:hypothetical protein